MSFNDKYTLLGDQILGKGTFAEVYVGESKEEPKQICAVKCIKKEKLSEDDVNGLKDEVSILQSMKHKNIIAIYDFFEEPNIYYVVTEKLTGELFDRIVAKSYYNENEARNVCAVLLDAIQYCHANGIVHRDLKPENLLLESTDDDSLVKIADFGFARRCNDAANGGLGNLKTQCGTPTYVAPEVLNRVSYGTKADMWSVGVILYILLGGYPPFVEDNQRELFNKIQTGSFEFHDEYFDHVSQDAKDLISSLLTVNPTDRLSASQVLNNKWICGDKNKLMEKDLTVPNFAKLKKFNAIRKVKAAIKSVIAVNKFTSLIVGDLKISKDPLSPKKSDGATPAKKRRV